MLGRFLRLSCNSAFVLSLLLGAVPASGGALVDPFGKETYRLSDAARELLKGAVRQVLESATAGTTADWQDPESGRAGRASLLRVFERDGMTCGEVEHVFTDGKGTRYVLPFCQVADGSWKVAF
jgi:surface antigen